jgi:hypothetical protein
MITQIKLVPHIAYESLLSFIGRLLGLHRFLQGCRIA